MTQPEQPDIITVFEGSSNKWYWHRQAGNGRIIAAGGESYENKQDAIDMATSLAAPRNGVAPVMTVL